MSSFRKSLSFRSRSRCAYNPRTRFRDLADNSLDGLLLENRCSSLPVIATRFASAIVIPLLAKTNDASATDRPASHSRTTETACPRPARAAWGNVGADFDLSSGGRAQKILRAIAFGEGQIP
jgi:hypothetical protein